MAFQTATGYTNLPNGVFSPTIYSQKVQKQFRKKTVVNDITNSDYFGEIANQGDTVRIIKEPEITVQALARGQQLVTQDIQDEDFTLTVDRANYYQFGVDDIEKQQAHVNWESLATDRAGYNLAQVFDRDVLGYMSGYETATPNGTVWTARTTPVGTKAESTADNDELFSIHKLNRSHFVTGGSTSESVAVGVQGTYDITPVDLLNRFNRLLDEQNVDKDGRWLVVDPVFLEILMAENSKFMNHDYQDTESLSNGKVMSAKVRGFRLYMSNNLPRIGNGPAVLDNNGSSTDYGVIIAGHDSAVATAEQISKTESFRSQNGFFDVVRGMHLYGRKILRPQGLLRAWYNKAN